MALVLDRTAGSIKRFDPSSGAYLGSFANGQVGSSSFNLLLDQSSGRVAVGSTNTAYNYAMPYYDYNTGNYLFDRYYSQGAYASTKVGSNVAAIFSTPTYVLAYDFYGTYSGYTVQSGSNYIMAAIGASNRIYGVDVANGRLSFWNSMYSSVPANTAIPNAATSLFYTGEMALSGNRLAFCSAAAGGGGSRVWLTDLNSDGSVASIRSIDISTRYSSAYHIAFGHNDDVYIGAYNSSGDAKYRIARYSWLTGTYRGEFGVGNLTDVGGLVFVAAPEPGTWAAMSLGALILLRRRKR